MTGRYCRLERLSSARHAADLHAANVRDADGRMWAYLPYGPFESQAAYAAWIDRDCTGADPLFFAIVDAATGKATGVASYLRIEPAVGCIEVGHLAFSPLLQRSPAATEAMFLMMERIYDAGYRRYEWKCNALNAPSRTAAMRLGFSYEGVFRQATIVKGRNRDTAWYASIDREWPALRAAFRMWLDPSNFDERGQQRVSLRALTAPVLVRQG
jgi:RimJ/RimL family protein N-acetyltransferase